MNSESGFTLVELMIAMAVSVIALLSIGAANNLIHQNSELAYEQSVVTQDMNEVIEQMRDAANAASDSSYQSSVVSTGSSASSSVVSLPASYQESINVSYTDQTADPLDATVTATWLQGGRRSKTLTMRALITRRA